MSDDPTKAIEADVIMEGIKARLPHVAPNTVPLHNKRLIVQRRRAHVAELYMMGLTMREIGQRLGINQGSICRDIQAIRQDYKLDIQAYVDREAASLDGMEKECVLRYRESKEAQWMLLRLKIKERRAKLLGLDAPVRNIHSGPDGGPIQNEHAHLHAMAEAQEFEQHVMDYVRRMKQQEEKEAEQQAESEPHAARALPPALIEAKEGMP